MRPHRTRSLLPLLTVAALAALVVVAMPSLAHAEEGDIFARALGKGGAAGIVLAFGAAYLAGLAAAATPCVYPMIGITVSVFGAKQAKSRKEAALLSTMFVLGIAALYVPLGVGVALSGSVWGRALSNPWISGTLALIFGAMAASMFGAFELSLPSSIQNRLAQVGGVGPKGAFTLGLVSGLIASPCTTAPFASILDSVKSMGVAFGALAVFLFSIGLGTPFFIVGTFAARMPKPGVWMAYVKSVFGVVLMIIAIGYLKPAIPALKKLIQPGHNFALITGGAAVFGLLIGAIHLSFGEGSALQRVRKTVGVLAAVAGGYLFLQWTQLPKEPVVASADPATGNASPAKPGAPKPVVWNTDESKARQLAANEKKPMLIDFTAEWCAACKELEKNTFTTEKFWKAAERFIALRIDGTDEDNPTFDKNSKAYGVQGLPAIVILDSSGKLAKIFKKKPETEELTSALEQVN
jgi:thiol:disulfide interchange protein DsbD